MNASNKSKQEKNEPKLIATPEGQQPNSSPSQLSNPQAQSSMPMPSLDDLSPEQIEALHQKAQEKEKFECFEAIKIILDKYGYELIPVHTMAGGRIVEAKVMIEKRISMPNPGG